MVIVKISVSILSEVSTAHALIQSLASHQTDSTVLVSSAGIILQVHYNQNFLIGYHASLLVKVLRIDLFIKVVWSRSWFKSLRHTSYS